MCSLYALRPRLASNVVDSGGSESVRCSVQLGIKELTALISFKVIHHSFTHLLCPCCVLLIQKDIMS